MQRVGLCMCGVCVYLSTCVVEERTRESCSLQSLRGAVRIDFTFVVPPLLPPWSQLLPIRSFNKIISPFRGSRQASALAPSAGPVPCLSKSDGEGPHLPSTNQLIALRPRAQNPRAILLLNSHYDPREGSGCIHPYYRREMRKQQGFELQVHAANK